MVPKSLPHQTLAKLFSETDRLLLFFFFLNQLNRINYSWLAELCQAMLFFYNNKKPESFEGFGFVYTLIILLFYTQTPNV